MEVIVAGATGRLGRLSEVLHRPITHSREVPGPLASMTPFFRWIAATGFHADIGALRAGYPGIGWHSLRQWAASSPPRLD